MTAAAPAETAERRPLERALDALPLVLAYVLLCCLYAWQASQRDSPTIFTDELEFAQISRSIAETGEAARRGVPYGFQTLYSFLVAPAWWIDDTASAYEAAKFIGVLVMTATIFPAYALARTIVSKPWALGAAVAAAAIPALSYAPFLVEEPLAYPVATTALWLIARALARPTRWTIATRRAPSACWRALVRAQLAILIPVFGARARRRGLGTSRVPAPPRAVVARRTGSASSCSAIGAALALSAFLGHRSEEWYRATGFYKERMFDYGLRALGALVIGIGVLPFVAGLTAVLTRGRDPDRNVRAFVLTSLAAFFTFGLYTAIKAAYISTEFGTVTVERNLIYVAPLLFAGTALVLERPGRRFVVLAGVTVVALYLLLTTPFELDKYPYYDAPGLAIAALPNRVWRWDGERDRAGARCRAAALGRPARRPRRRPRPTSGAARCRHRRARHRLERDRPGLCRGGSQRLRPPPPRERAAARRLARPGDGRRAGALPRRSGRRRERDPPARVLEPLSEAGLEPRRLGARAGPDAVA